MKKLHYLGTSDVTEFYVLKKKTCFNFKLNDKDY